MWKGIGEHDLYAILKLESVVKLFRFVPPFLFRKYFSMVVESRTKQGSYVALSSLCHLSVGHYLPVFLKPAFPFPRSASFSKYCFWKQTSFWGPVIWPWTCPELQPETSMFWIYLLRHRLLKNSLCVWARTWLWWTWHIMGIRSEDSLSEYLPNPIIDFQRPDCFLHPSIL